MVMAMSHRTVAEELGASLATAGGQHVTIESNLRNI